MRWSMAHCHNAMGRSVTCHCTITQIDERLKCVVSLRLMILKKCCLILLLSKIETLFKYWITLFRPKEFSIKLHTEGFILYIERSQVLFPKSSLKSDFVFKLANSVDPDKMPHYAALRLGLHCLLNYPKQTFNGRLKLWFVEWYRNIRLLQECGGSV